MEKPGSPKRRITSSRERPGVTKSVTSCSVNVVTAGGAGGCWRPQPTPNRQAVRSEAMTETEAARAARPFSTNSVIHSLSEVPRSAASDLTCRSISSGRSYVARMAMLFHEHIVASTHALGPRPSPGAPFIPWDRARPRAHPSCPPLPRSGRGRPRSQAPLMPWDRARPRAHPSCPPSPRSGRGRPRSQAPLMPSLAPQRPRTAAPPDASKPAS